MCSIHPEKAHGSIQVPYVRLMFYVSELCISGQGCVYQSQQHEKWKVVEQSLLSEYTKKKTIEWEKWSFLYVLVASKGAAYDSQL